MSKEKTSFFNVSKQKSDSEQIFGSNAGWTAQKKREFTNLPDTTG